MINDPNSVIMKVYAARDYKDKTYRQDNCVEVNIPEYAPTVPQDADHNNVGIGTGFFVNTNYPIVPAIVKSTHYIKLPIMKGTTSTCPVVFEKGTEFLLVYPTGKIEEGSLIYI